MKRFALVLTIFAVLSALFIPYVLELLQAYSHVGTFALASAPVASTGLQEDVNEDMEEIRDAMKDSPVAVVRAVFFAMGSIQIRFSTFIERLDGSWESFLQGGASAVDAPVLYGAFTRGMKEVWNRRHELHGAVVDAQREDTREAALNLLAVFHSVTGLGLVKAAFCTQFATGRLACLDTRNVQRFGLDQKELQLMNNRVNAVQEYNELLQELDRTGPEIWADWCAEIGARDSWPDGTEVSDVHRRFIADGVAKAALN